MEKDALLKLFAVSICKQRVEKGVQLDSKRMNAEGRTGYSGKGCREVEISKKTLSVQRTWLECLEVVENIPQISEIGV